jgi:hypothetical protein
MIDRITALCLVGSVVLSGFLLLELRSGVAEPTTLSEPSAKSAGPPPAPMNELAIKQLVATTLARPLFSATRRPPEREQGSSPDTPLKDLRLTGILILPDQRIAIFARTEDKPLVLSEGEMISDWHIDNITAQSVSLSGPTGTITLEPRSDPKLVRGRQSAAKPTMSPPAPTAANQPSVPAPTPMRPVRPELLPGQRASHL